MPNGPTGTGSHMAARYWLTDAGMAATEDVAQAIRECAEAAREELAEARGRYGVST